MPKNTFDTLPVPVAGYVDAGKHFDADKVKKWTITLALNRAVKLCEEDHLKSLTPYYPAPFSPKQASLVRVSHEKRYALEEEIPHDVIMGLLMQLTPLHRAIFLETVKMFHPKLDTAPLQERLDVSATSPKKTRRVLKELLKSLPSNMVRKAHRTKSAPAVIARPATTAISSRLGSDSKADGASSSRHGPKPSVKQQMDAQALHPKAKSADALIGSTVDDDNPDDLTSPFHRIAEVVGRTGSRRKRYCDRHFDGCTPLQHAAWSE